jgi:ribonuclease Z
MKTVLVSHGHMDHLGAIGYWASQRHLQSMGPAVLVAPREIADGVETLLDTHARLEGGNPYEVEVRAVAAGDSIAVRRNMRVEFFTTDHWVPTLGSRLIWRRHRLLPELSSLTGDEIARRRRDGERVTEDVETALLAYCADSGPKVLGPESPALDAEVLLLECSFFRDRDRDRAVRFGHMHLQDILARTDRFRCRHLVVLHASRRHRLREVEELLETRLRPALGCTVHHLLVDWD